MTKADLERLSKSQRKALEKIREIVNNGHIGDENELIRLAKKAGYYLEGHGKHLTIYKDEGEMLLSKTGQPVTIPCHHSQGINGHVYQNVLKEIIRDDDLRY